MKDQIWIRWFLFKEWLKSDLLFYSLALIIFMAIVVMIFSMFELFLSAFPDMIKILM